MIGLSPLGAKLYGQLLAKYEACGIPLSDEEVRKASTLGAWHTKLKLDQLKRRGFIGFDRTGRIVVCRPPHEVILAQVALATGLSVADIVGPSHESSLVRARKMIAKRLRKDFSYSNSQIAKILQRHVNSVREYFHPGYAALRAKARSVKLYGERTAA